MNGDLGCVDAPRLFGGEIVILRVVVDVALQRGGRALAVDPRDLAAVGLGTRRGGVGQHGGRSPVVAQARVVPAVGDLGAACTGCCQAGVDADNGTKLVRMIE